MERLLYLVMDIDGTLTDSGIYYDATGNELKRFSTRDGTGILALRAAGVRMIVLTGRKCAATQRRMEELGVEEIFQDVKDKAAFLKQLMDSRGIAKEQIGYVGDDLNDLAAMQYTGFVACPCDAAEEVKQIADYICKTRGGSGVMRELAGYLLQKP